MRTQNDPPGVSFPYRLFLSTTTGSSQIADTWRVPTPPSSAALGTKRAVSHNVAPDPATSKGDDQWTTGMNQKNGVFFGNWVVYPPLIYAFHRFSVSVRSQIFEFTALTRKILSAWYLRLSKSRLT